MANPWLVPCRKDDDLTTWDATGFPSPGRILHGNKLTQNGEHLAKYFLDAAKNLGHFLEYLESIPTGWSIYWKFQLFSGSSTGGSM